VQLVRKDQLVHKVRKAQLVLKVLPAFRAQLGHRV
jgi:hypothetical protein